MFTQKSHRFLLSARKVGTHFYISQYESFPDYVDTIGDGKPPTARFCAILRQEPTEENRYKLWLCGCEDEGMYYALERFPISPGPGRAAEETVDGQLLADVR